MAKKQIPKNLIPVRRRVRTVIPIKKEPLKDKHKTEVHHIKFQRHGGSNEEHNLVSLTPEEHRALHAKADYKLRSSNGKKVMAKPGHAKALGLRRQYLHRKLAGEVKYSEHMKAMANKRWATYKAKNEKPKTLIQKIKGTIFSNAKSIKAKTDSVSKKNKG